MIYNNWKAPPANAKKATAAGTINEPISTTGIGAAFLVEVELAELPVLLPLPLA